jgi:hypothetical protein
MLSTREVAAALGLTIGALQQLIFRGIIRPPGRRLGPSYVWDGGEVETARRALQDWRGRRKQPQGGPAVA